VGLTVTKVSLRDFRSYSEFELLPDPSLTVLAGHNAVGKTNIVEAIELLTEANSFRKPAWGETVRQGAQAARLELFAEGDDRSLHIQLDVSAAGRRSYQVNGKKRRAITQVAGIIPCVVFTPDDLRMVKDSAERRRSSLDDLGCQLSPSYALLKAEYERILRQRNKLLREEAAEETLEPWTDNLVDKGAKLLVHRRRLFEKMEQGIRQVYPHLTGGGVIEARYVPSWERDGIGSKEEDPEQSMWRHLRERRAAERGRRSTVSGPHRDEIVFEIEERDARTYASQGQQRTIALAWKLAEVDVITTVSSQRPVLLLDDVMSELDEKRRHALASFVGSAAQTIVTTTNLGYFDKELLERAKVVNLG